MALPALVEIWWKQRRRRADERLLVFPDEQPTVSFWTFLRRSSSAARTLRLSRTSWADLFQHRREVVLDGLGECLGHPRMPTGLALVGEPVGEGRA
jgi:hypothetical protein